MSLMRKAWGSASVEKLVLAVFAISAMMLMTIMMQASNQMQTKKQEKQISDTTESTRSFQCHNESRTGDSTPAPSREFSYLLEPELDFDELQRDSCHQGQEVRWRMVIFVKSTASNFYRREYIRRTWASLSYVQGIALKTIFIVGRASVRNTELVNEEQRRYGDILQFAGHDTYWYIATKTMAGMQWASQHLNDGDLYTTADDDFLINLAKMEEIITFFNATMVKRKWPEFPILCMYRFWSNAAPERNEHSKYFISKGEYKWTKWPPFCLGGMYTASVSVVKQLWELAKVHEPLRMDDVWITGVLREKLGMPSTMIFKPEGKVATHMTGFRGKAARNIRDFMWEDWKNVSVALKDKKTCVSPHNRLRFS